MLLNLHGRRFRQAHRHCTDWPALNSHKLRRTARLSVTELEDEICKWINKWNKDPRVRLGNVR